MTISLQHLKLLFIMWSASALRRDVSQTAASVERMDWTARIFEDSGEPCENVRSDEDDDSGDSNEW